MRRNVYLILDTTGKNWKVRRRGLLFFFVRRVC